MHLSSQPRFITSYWALVAGLLLPAPHRCSLVAQGMSDHHPDCGNKDDGGKIICSEAAEFHWNYKKKHGWI